MTTRLMGNMSFRALFGDLGVQETRTVQVLETSPVGTPGRLPVDDYAFDEWYCVDPNCDCRRVIFLVVADRAGGHLASISHSFDPPGKRDWMPEQTFLDPLLPQSKLAPAVLDLCNEWLLSDAAYCRRLERHYRTVKEAVADPGHPCQRLLRVSETEQTSNKPRVQDILPPKRRGKRKWR